VTYPDLRRKTLSFVKRRPVSVILVEDTAGGNALVSDLRQRLPQGISVHGIVPLASKRERLRAVMDLVRGGLVFLPKSADWLEDFLQQLEEFPEGAFDDQVDAMVQYLGWTKENSAPASRPQRAMGVLVKGPRSDYVSARVRPFPPSCGSYKCVEPSSEGLGSTRNRRRNARLSSYRVESLGDVGP
jgi:predicted phage terminase large subunit-like protein